MDRTPEQSGGSSSDNPHTAEVKPAQETFEEFERMATIRLDELSPENPNLLSEVELQAGKIAQQRNPFSADGKPYEQPITDHYRTIVQRLPPGNGRVCSLTDCLRIVQESLDEAKRAGGPPDELKAACECFRVLAIEAAVKCIYGPQASVMEWKYDKWSAAQKNGAAQTAAQRHLTNERGAASMPPSAPNRGSHILTNVRQSIVWCLSFVR